MEGRVDECTNTQTQTQTLATGIHGRAGRVSKKGIEVKVTA